MYEVTLSNRAEKRLSRLPVGEYERVLQAVTSLAEDPRPRNCRKLQGREGWRIRVGLPAGRQATIELFTR